MLDHKDEHSIEKMARIKEVSRSGYYDWLKREASPRDAENAQIFQDMMEIFLQSRESMGSRRLAKELSKRYGRRINRKRVARLMKERGVPEGHIQVHSEGGTAEYNPVEANRNCRIELFIR